MPASKAGALPLGDAPILGRLRSIASEIPIAIPSESLYPVMRIGRCAALNGDELITQLDC